MKALLKQALYRVAPEWTAAAQAARARALSHRLFRRWGLIDLNRKLLAHLPPVVRGGPFRGMTLTPMTFAEHLGPYLLGTYEVGLHPWVEALAGRPFAQVVNVGAKFGYYAVGLAWRSPRMPIIAFDPDGWARRAVREMAAANATPNVTPARFCSPAWLDRHLGPASLIVCDCEGYEGDLFGAATTPALDTATVLVETHEEVTPGVTAALRRRFARTHHAAEVTDDGPAAAPPTDLLTDLPFLTPDEVRSAAREVRGPQTWLLFTPMGEAR